MPLSQDPVTFQKKLAALPVMKCQAGDEVLIAGSRTGKLFFLKSGAVEVTKDGVQIAKVSTPGAVFGELAALLDQSHTADVRALERSEFLVADAETLLAVDSAVALYVAAILAHRLDSANRALLGVKRQLLAGESRRAITKNVEKVEELLVFPMDASLIHAGYPYDPIAGRPNA
ncbi:MAG TPA: cyclic nucleotide-binding domain-containing protein [Stellaceae bacterium]|nr:cyclic nucleotide-binding domain-containing protein [Stellaceae bacterium]